MARKSKIERLPEEIRSEIEDLRDAGRTIDEILTKLRELGVGENDISRPGLGRWTKKWDAMRERMAESRSAAEAMMARLEVTGSDKRVAEFNISALHANIMQLMAGEDGEPVTLDPKSAKVLSEAIRNLTSAAKSDQDRMILLKREIAREAQAQLAEAEKEARAADGKLDGAALLARIRSIYDIQ